MLGISGGLRGAFVFISASIPDPARWDGDYDPAQISDAVVSTARGILAAGGRLVTAAHPTIAPMLLYVASEIPGQDSGAPIVRVFQSALFERLLPVETQRFRDSGIGRVTFVPAVEGETPHPGNRDQSLRQMRTAMLRETEPVAAVFIGGMGGIREEWEQVRDELPRCRRYAFGKPGGVASELAGGSSGADPQLKDLDLYPFLADLIVDDIVASY